MRVSLRSKLVKLSLPLDCLTNGWVFSTPLFSQVMDILCFRLVPHSGRLMSMDSLRLTMLGTQDWSFRAMWSLKQDTCSCLLTGLDGPLLQFGTPVSKGTIKPDSKLLTRALFLEFWKASLTLGSGSFKASSLRRGLLSIGSGPIVIIEQWPHGGLRLSELFGQIIEVLCRPKDSWGNAWVAHPYLITAHCVCLQCLDHWSNYHVSLYVLG